jgi:hypothetical protein
MVKITVTDFFFVVMIHTINAWEEENANSEMCLVLVAPNLLGIEHALDHGTRALVRGKG